LASTKPVAAAAQPEAQTHAPCDHLERALQSYRNEIRPHQAAAARNACRPGSYLSGACSAYRRAQNEINRLNPLLRRTQIELKACRASEQARHDLERIEQANAAAAEAARRNAEETGRRIQQQQEAAAERARQQAAAHEASSAANDESRFGSTIAAVGGAALLAGGLAWLLWPDAKSTIQPWVQGRNDGRGYSAGIQAFLGKNQHLILHQTDGPTELRFTGVRWELRW